MSNPTTSKDTNIEKNSPPSRDELLISLGHRLQSGRQEAAISLLDASSHLNLSQSYLEALEHGDWSIMPGDVYALGFLRQYAKYLHLDIEDSVEQLKLSQYTLTKPITFPDPALAPNKTWMVVSLLAFLLLFVVFNMFDHEPAPLPSQLIQQHAAEKLDSDPIENITLEKNMPDNAIIEATPETIVNTPPAELSIAQPAISKAIVNTQQPKSFTPKITTPVATPTVMSPSITEHTYHLKAVDADVWLQLHEATEPPVLIREALLRQGQYINVTKSGRVLLTTGNAASLEVMLDDILMIKVGSLGKKGEVLRNFELTLPTE